MPPPSLTCLLRPFSASRMFPGKNTNNCWLILVRATRCASSTIREGWKSWVIYAALGVPELWRVYKKTVRIYLLSQDNYTESLTSRAFPFLTSETLSEFLALGV